MDISLKCCVVNAALGKWYPRGQKRLVDTLRHVGFHHDILAFDGWANNNYDKSCGYNVKAAAIEEAIKRGYDIILWLDCSVWPVKNPEPIFDLINEQGYYFWKNGYNCAQECSDACLNYFGVNRDLAETWDIASTSMFGFNLNNPIGKEFAERWLKSAKDKVFHGSREHDNQSYDKRFLWHRQDQSAASIICNQLGCKIHEPREYSMYYEEGNIPESVLFVMRGM